MSMIELQIWHLPLLNFKVAIQINLPCFANENSFYKNLKTQNAQFRIFIQNRFSLPVIACKELNRHFYKVTFRSH